METKVFPELQEKYLADPKSGPCPCFKADAMNAARMYKESGFSLEECMETSAKQFHVGKKATRELVKKIYEE